MWTMDRNPVTIKIFADVGSFFLKKSSTDKQIHLDAILQRKISPNQIGYKNLLCEPVPSSPVMVILQFWISNFNTFFSAVFLALQPSHVSPILDKCKNCKRKTFVCNSKLHTCVRKLREIASHLSSSFITVLNKDFKGFQIFFLADMLSVHLIFVTSIWQYLARTLVFRKFLFLNLPDICKLTQPYYVRWWLKAFLLLHKSEHIH